MRSGCSCRIACARLGCRRIRLGRGGALLIGDRGARGVCGWRIRTIGLRASCQRSPHQDGHDKNSRDHDVPLPRRCWLAEKTAPLSAGCSRRQGDNCASDRRVPLFSSGAVARSTRQSFHVAAILRTGLPVISNCAPCWFPWRIPACLPISIAARSAASRSSAASISLSTRNPIRCAPSAAARKSSLCSPISTPRRRRRVEPVAQSLNLERSNEDARATA
jgi:hypothetical protein